MAAKMGILGESDSTSAGLTTIYSVPADKGSHCRLLMSVEHAGGVRPFQIQIGANPEFIFMDSSSSDRLFGFTPGTNATPETARPGLYIDSNLLDHIDALSTCGLAVPFGNFFLSETDTVKINKGGGSQILSIVFQALGVEDDA